MGYREIAVEALEQLEAVRDVFGAMAGGCKIDAKVLSGLTATLLTKPSELRLRLAREDSVAGFRREIDDL